MAREPLKVDSMGRTRMGWDWVRDYPVFVYTNFIEHFKFKVRIMIGEKGNPSSKGHGPTSRPNIEYIQEGLISRRKIVEEALKQAEDLINLEESN